ncbi:MAG: RluA family pseudouridine synthase [Polyangiaceae bacterium]|nr:RluA family pseudouridine synthase [Polyangiaceae bacterium]
MAHRLVLGADDLRDRVDKVLALRLLGVSRSTVQRWITEGRVLVNGAPCRPRDVVGPGAVIEVDPGPAPPSRAEPDADVVFDVVFEDEHLAVIDKPAGLVVHPARGHARRTLVNGLLARPGFSASVVDAKDAEGALRPGIVHRLDKDTSGLLVVAKDDVTREGLKRQLAAHSMDRIYRALTIGVPREGTIDVLHGRHPRSRLRFSSFVADGRRAVTHVRIVEVLAHGLAALVECRLETGRTHQIRVHLSERARTPVLGDVLYGGEARGTPLVALVARLGRHALHAAVLGFEHPIDGHRLLFQSAWPRALAAVVAELRSM